MKRIFAALLICTLFVACNSENKGTLRVAGASNMKFALEEITQQFQLTSGIKTELITASSGKLTTQIKEGAPFDVFLSADIKFPTELYKSGLTKEAPKVYAKGSLVLWTTEKFTPTIEMLRHDSIRKIAVSNPKTAPYGKAGIDFLKTNGLYEHIKDKLVFGESVTQTNQFVATKSVPIGLTAASSLYYYAKKLDIRTVKIPNNLYQPILQGVVQTNKESDDATKFINYLFSEEGTKILNKFGYQVNDL